MLFSLSLKVEMQRYLHEMRWSDALAEDFAAVRKASRRGELGLSRSPYSRAGQP